MQIHRVKSRGANSYIIDEDGRLMVIDVAFMADKKVMAYVTDTLQRNLQDVDLVVCTHGHTDHMGGLRKAALQCQAKIAIPPSTSLWREKLNPLVSLASLASWLDRQASGFISRKTANSRPEAHMTDPSVIRLQPTGSLPGFDNWMTIHTPGHTEDSCCYFHLPSRSLITGDTLLASGRSNTLVLPSIYNNRSKLLQSIAGLRNLNPASIYPGHGSVLSGSDLLADVAGIS
jgi:glyoxylase-like metal-dependent hydrolase (beta-lactamase superfamily II)|tara:strand:- start:639 stop:1331 length:693 start_codon:yes stop_codon:yes gene_type:complete